MSESIIRFHPRDEILNGCDLLYLENQDLNDYQKYRLRGMMKRNLRDVYERSIQSVPYNSPHYKGHNPEERLRGFAQVAFALGSSNTALKIYSVKNQIKLDAHLYSSYEESTIPGMINLIDYPTERFEVRLSEYARDDFLFHKVLAENGELGRSLRDPMERIRANGISLSTISWNCSMDSYKILELLSSMTWCSLGDAISSNVV